MLELLILGVYLVILYTSAFLFLVLIEADTVRSEVRHPESWPSLTVAVPAYNEEETLGMTVESVLDAEYPGEKQVIVVDDGSKDGTREIAESYSPEVTVISQENQGKGAALNTALDEAETELFACVDADSKLQEDSLKNIVARMDGDTAAVASAMKVRDPENLIQRIQMVEYVVNIFSRKLFQRIDSIHVTPGPLSVYRREKIEQVGGFDPSSKVEDQEICFRLQRNHEKLKHARKGEVLTEAPDNLRDYYRQRRRWYAGTFETLIQYRDMFLNRDYGDFGMFVMPSKVVHPAISIFGLFLIIYTMLRPLYSLLADFTRLGFDAFSFGVAVTPAALANAVKWQVLSLDYTLLTLLAGLALFSISMVYLASRHVEEQVNDIGFLPSIIYVFWFFIIIGFMSLVSLAVVVRSRMSGADIAW